MEKCTAVKGEYRCQLWAPHKGSHKMRALTKRGIRVEYRWRDGHAVRAWKI